MFVQNVAHNFLILLFKLNTSFSSIGLEFIGQILKLIFSKCKEMDFFVTRNKLNVILMHFEVDTVDNCTVSVLLLKRSGNLDQCKHEDKSVSKVILVYLHFVTISNQMLFSLILTLPHSKNEYKLEKFIFNEEFHSCE